jgi:peptidoglycan/xylan/chitin deacetylase (PgdA/CDA1 family)
MRPKLPSPPMRRALVLGYHAISAQWPCTLAVSPHALEQQLERVVRRGYRGVTLTELATVRQADRVVVVTFDDAYRSVLELAFPILERLGLPGTVFAPTDHMDGRPMSWPGIDGWLHTEHRAELTGCTWDELSVLARAGWEIGSHTCTHARLPTLADDALADELGRSRQECEQRLGTPCLTIAYPYGASDARVATAARAAGYVATVGGRPSPGGPAHALRADIYRKDDAWRVALKTSVLHGGLTRLAQVRVRPASDAR